eukprot:scaffold197403_cov28-Prasinocladus_malaysianus.AAC.1
MTRTTPGAVWSRSASRQKAAISLMRWSESATYLIGAPVWFKTARMGKNVLKLRPGQICGLHPHGDGPCATGTIRNVLEGGIISFVL